MSERYEGFIVVLENEVKDEFSESTISAIRHIKGVLDVKPIVATADSYSAGLREKTEILKKLSEFLRKEYMEM